MRDGVNFCDCLAAPLRHARDEFVIMPPQKMLHALLFFRRARPRTEKYAGIFAALENCKMNAEPFEQTLKMIFRAVNPNGSGNRQRIGENFIRRRGNHIAAGSCQIGHGDVKRLFLAQLLHRVADDV